MNEVGARGPPLDGLPSVRKRRLKSSKVARLHTAVLSTDVQTTTYRRRAARRSRAKLLHIATGPDGRTLSQPQARRRAAPRAPTPPRPVRSPRSSAALRQQRPRRAGATLAAPARHESPLATRGAPRQRGHRLLPRRLPARRLAARRRQALEDGLDVLLRRAAQPRNTLATTTRAWARPTAASSWPGRSRRWKPQPQPAHALPAAAAHGGSSDWSCCSSAARPKEPSSMAGQGVWLACPTSLARADRTAPAAPPCLAAPCLARRAVRLGAPPSLARGAPAGPAGPARGGPAGAPPRLVGHIRTLATYVHSLPSSSPPAGKS